MKLRKNLVDRALRGGSYMNKPSYLRNTNRNRYSPLSRYWFSGFRFVVRGQK